MKLASFCRPDASRGWGLVTDAGIIDLASESAGLRQALEDGISWADHADREPSFQVNQVEFLPPIPDPEKIICVGLNYRSHIAKSGREAPKKPVIFTRFANSQMGHGQPMVRPNASEQLDFEGELAVIIGKRGRHFAATRPSITCSAIVVTMTAPCAIGRGTRTSSRRARISSAPVALARGS